MDIEEKKAAAMTKFEQLSAEAEQHRSRVEEIEDELKRLQGEYRAYESIQADPATTITAIEDTPKKEKKSGK